METGKAGRGFIHGHWKIIVTVGLVIAVWAAVGAYVILRGTEPGGSKRVDISTESKEVAVEVPGEEATPSGDAVARAAREPRYVEKIVFRRDNKIWIMNPDGSDQKQLTWTGYDSGPALSPDGGSVAFSRYSKEYMEGGYTGNDRSSIFMIGVDGRNVTKVTPPAGKPTCRADPSFSPDGGHICYSYWESTSGGDDTPAEDMCGIAVLDVRGGEPKGTTRVLTRSAFDAPPFGCPRFSPAGDFLYFNDSPGGGPPAVSIERIRTDGTCREPIAPFEEIGGETETQLCGYGEFDVSPDGARIACISGSYDNLSYTYTSKICLMNMDGTGRRFIDIDIGWVHGVSWSPDGLKLVFTDGDLPNPAIYRINADGSGLEKVADDVSEPDWGRIRVVD